MLSCDTLEYQRANQRANQGQRQHVNLREQSKDKDNTSDSKEQSKGSASICTMHLPTLPIYVCYVMFLLICFNTYWSIHLLLESKSKSKVKFNQKLDQGCWFFRILFLGLNSFISSILQFSVAYGTYWNAYGKLDSVPCRDQVKKEPWFYPQDDQSPSFIIRPPITPQGLLYHINEQSTSNKYNWASTI